MVKKTKKAICKPTEHKPITNQTFSMSQEKIAKYQKLNILNILKKASHYIDDAQTLTHTHT